MKPAGSWLCAYCGEDVPAFGDTMLTVRILEADGPMVALRWHVTATPCHELDGLHLKLAEAVELHGQAGADAVRDAMSAIRARAAARGVDCLRRTLDIRRDLTDHRFTLRGPGDAWGLKVARGAA